MTSNKYPLSPKTASELGRLNFAFVFVGVWMQHASQMGPGTNMCFMIENGSKYLILYQKSNILQGIL